MFIGEACEGRIGLPGACKTLDQTEQVILPLLIDGEDVHCSYWLNWNKPNNHYFHPEDFDAVRYVRNCAVAFDEIAQTFDPRRYDAEDSGVRSWFQLHRHRHISIYFNTQDVSLVAKTVGIVADRWLFLTNANDGLIMAKLRGIFGAKPRVATFIEEMTFQELRRLASGYENPIPFNYGGDDDDYVDENLPPPGRFVAYTIDKILHPELDDHKIELYHKYCPLCASRQGTQILKADTLKEVRLDKKSALRHKLKFSFKDVSLRIPIPRYEEKCPKHKKQNLIIRESAMYDTEYEPSIRHQDIIFKPYIDCPKGYKQIEYRGPLSDDQLSLKRQLENNYKQNV